MKTKSLIFLFRENSELPPLKNPSVEAGQTMQNG